MRASRILSILLVAVLALGMLPAAAGGAVKVQSAPVGEEFQITFEEHSQNQIEFWGDTVVYSDHRGGQTRVYGTDLGGNSEFPVSITTGNQNNPSVYGDNVVYMKKRMVWDDPDNAWEDVGDIMGYKISTGETFPVCTDDAEQGNPFIWGSKVAWVDHRNTNDPFDGDSNRSDVYVYDMETEDLQTFDTSPTVSGLSAPIVFEDWLLAKERVLSNSDGNLWLFDLSGSQEPTKVPDSWSDHYSWLASPSIWGDWIVWQQYNTGNGRYDVKACDLTSMETTVVCDTGAGGGVDVWDDYVVWEDRRDGNGDIYMADLITSDETTICANESEQGRPRIENGTIVWVDERNADLMEIDNADVYGMYLMPQTASFAGLDRYATAAMASRKAFGSGAETVVIATGANWPDALASSGLAGAAGGPVLLTRYDEIPAVVMAEILRLGAKNAYIIGGTRAISADVETALGNLLTGEITRLGGPTRYETASLVSDEAIDLLGPDFSGTAILASGINPPDAVSASALSAGLGMPLYLTGTSTLPASVKTAMSGAGVDDVYIVGGTAAISAAVMTEVDTAFDVVERLYGNDRYQTSIAIAEEGVDLGLTWDGVGFATGTNFPDALSGGVVQGLNSSVMLLTPGTTMNADIEAVVEANKADIGLVRFYGGTAAIADSVRTAIEAIVNS